MKKDYLRQHLSSDKYETDKWIRAMFPSGSWLDPCPIDYHPDTHTSGLDYDWQWSVVNEDKLGVFVNPPYSNPLPWVKKALRENYDDLTIVMLLKHDSSTEWFRLLHEAGARMMMINKRLKYGTERGAAFPSVLVVLS